jgi:peptide/nickel transport system permease protein
MSSLTLASGTRRVSATPAFANRLRRQRNSLLVFAALGLVLFVLLFGRQLAPYDPLKPQMTVRLQAPSAGHLMGTDPLGRDVFSRVLTGARTSLKSVLVIIVSAVGVGLLLGAVGGFFGGVIDDAIMRLTDCFLAFPALVLALTIAGALGPSLTNAMLAVSIVWWPWYARLTRGQVLAVKEEPYIEAARSIGASSRRILGRHILPNILAPIIVQATLDMGSALVTTAGLSFIGMGAQPPSAEWGAMLSQGRGFFLNAWWLSAFPGLAIFLAVLVFNAAGELVRSALPK